ncbi:MAG TPA: TadE/TadG family type IV pilus assembly protein [Candidatus Udaeobacter sp.]|nr:TadE/TadG family type IV pilus assembly protein [Candidatus Udaeobacter sp.]
MTHRKDQAGQSLVEFAVSSVVLLLLVGGLVDIGRSIYIQESLSNAVREGARHGIWYDAPSLSHPYLDDVQIKAAVDVQLAAISLPASVLKTPGCPSPSDGNVLHNPPYGSSYYPTVANQPWLYICYNNSPGNDYPSSPPSGSVGGWDLNVIVLYSYAPLTPAARTQFGIFDVAANQHMSVQGS